MLLLREVWCTIRHNSSLYCSRMNDASSHVTQEHTQRTVIKHNHLISCISLLYTALYVLELIFKYTAHVLRCRLQKTHTCLLPLYRLGNKNHYAGVENCLTLSVVTIQGIYVEFVRQIFDFTWKIFIWPISPRLNETQLKLYLIKNQSTTVQTY